LAYDLASSKLKSVWNPIQFINQIKFNNIGIYFRPFQIIQI
jgi:hypothetical protein